MAVQVLLDGGLGELASHYSSVQKGQEKPGGPSVVSSVGGRVLVSFTC